jgi:hypothetical protein
MPRCSNFRNDVKNYRLPNELILDLSNLNKVTSGDGATIIEVNP